jgi:hypothetical protein
MPVVSREFGEEIDSLAAEQLGEPEHERHDRDK